MITIPPLKMVMAGGWIMTLFCLRYMNIYWEIIDILVILDMNISWGIMGTRMI